MDQDFIKRHPRDSAFWAFIWLYILVIVLLGFREPVTDRFFDEYQETASLALVIHVWSFAAWLVLLAVQAFLAGTRRLNWHRSIGIAMLPLAIVMLASAGLAEWDVQVRSVAEGSTGGFSAITASYLLPFCILVPLAWIARRDPPAHKRLVLMATASIYAGAHLRTLLSFDPEAFFGDNAYLYTLVTAFGGSLLIIGFGIAWDLASRGRIHRVYWIGTPILVALYMLATWAYTDEGYASFARGLIGG